MKINRRAFIAGSGVCLLKLAFFPSHLKSQSPDHIVIPRRIFITTDLGGLDYDDYLSAIHALLYSNQFELEGLCPGREFGKLSAAKKVLQAYSNDYHKLAAHGYPEPHTIDAVMRQGSKKRF